MRDGLTQLWGLRGPTVSHLQAGVWKYWCCSSSPDLKSWEPGVPMSEGRRDGCLSSGRENFFSAWGFTGLENVHPHWWGPSPSLSLLIGLLMPSQTHPGIVFYQLSGHPLARSDWHIMSPIATGSSWKNLFVFSNTRLVSHEWQWLVRAHGGSIFSRAVFLQFSTLHCSLLSYVSSPSFTHAGPVASEFVIPALWGTMSTTEKVKSVFWKHREAKWKKRHKAGISKLGLQDENKLIKWQRKSYSWQREQHVQR